MPIPLGILAAAGFRPTAGGSYELIETITVGAGGAASVTFSNLNTYSTTYQHLQIRYSADGFTTFGDFELTFNADTTYGNYRSHYLYSGGGGSPTSQDNGNTPYPGYQWFAGVSAGVIDILDPYETSKNTTARGLIGNTITGAGTIMLTSLLWMNTAAVSSVRFRNIRQNLPASFRISIYGLRSS